MGLAQLGHTQAASPIVAPYGGDELFLGQLADDSRCGMVAQHGHRRQTGKILKHALHLGKQLTYSAVQTVLLARDLAAQSLIQGGNLPQFGIVAMQQLRFGELACAEQVGNGEGIAHIIFGPIQLVPFAMFLDRERIDQPVDQLMFLQFSGQQLPQIVARLHAH